MPEIRECITFHKYMYVSIDFTMVVVETIYGL